MKSIGEIERDPALRLYGAFIAATHVLSFLHWKLVHPAAVFLSSEVTPVCWPFFDECHRWRVLDRAGADAVVWSYGAAALVVTAAFARRPWLRGAYWGLVALTLFKALIVFADYRLRLNQHYMALWVTAVWAFVPHKRLALQALLVTFYVWAGILKLNVEWLSGEALLGQAPLFVPESLLVPACWYVVVLELLLVFGLFSRRPWIFWGTLAQLVAFHVASWPVVNFFYPTLMFALLAIFPLGRLVAEPAAPARKSKRGRRRADPMPARRTAFRVAGAFSALQLVPYAFPGDSALTGQGRMFALHMFDAKVVCRAVATLHSTDGGARPMALTARLPARIVCDPLVYFHFARGICRERAGRAGFENLDLLLVSKRGRDETPTKVIDVKSFCSSDLSYDVWRANPWISGG